MTTVLKAHCPRCDGERSCEMHGLFEEPWEWTDGQHYQYGQKDHRLVRCCGCGQVFYYLSSWNSEDWDGRINPSTGKEEIYHPVSVVTYPTPEKAPGKPDWVWGISTVDPQLYSILSETYEAYEAGSLILASIGLRTAFDRATEILKINPGHSLEAKVTRLLDDGFIGETEALTLQVVTQAGNAAAHRAWSPSQSEFRTLLTTLEQFIQRTIVSGKAALEIAAKIPPRHPRPSKT